MGCCSLNISSVWSVGCCWPQFCGSTSSDQDSDQLHFSKNVHRINSMQSWEATLLQASKGGQFVVVNFMASWSNPCKDIASTYAELADTYTNLVFLTVDVDELAELSSSWDIKATPTFYFLKDGRQVDKLVGANNADLRKKTAAIAALGTKPPN